MSQPLRRSRKRSRASFRRKEATPFRSSPPARRPQCHLLPASVDHSPSLLARSVRNPSSGRRPPRTGSRGLAASRADRSRPAVWPSRRRCGTTGQRPRAGAPTCRCCPVRRSPPGPSRPGGPADLTPPGTAVGPDGREARTPFPAVGAVPSASNRSDPRGRGASPQPTVRGPASALHQVGLTISVASGGGSSDFRAARPM